MKPCPFCGPEGQPYLHYRIGNEQAKKRLVTVGCLTCGFNKRIAVIRQTLDWAEGRAMECWNKRNGEAV